jgi:hypothetical protein
LSKLIDKTNAENKKPLEYNISYSFDTPLKKNITINSNATPQVPCFSIVMCVITDYNTGNYQIVKSIINWDVKYPQVSSGGMPSWEIGLFVFAGLVTAGIADAALLGIGVDSAVSSSFLPMITFGGGGLDVETISSFTEAVVSS